MSEERETRLFMISPRSMLTPDQLVRMIHAFGVEPIVKETCYGCLVEGPRSLVLEIRDKVREKYRNEVFTKIRAVHSTERGRDSHSWRRSGSSSRRSSTVSRRSRRGPSTCLPRRRNAFP